MAVAPADDAAPDAEYQGYPRVGGYLFPKVSQRPGDQRAKRARPLAVAECGALRGEVRGQPTNRRPAHRSLQWRTGDVPLPVSPYRPAGVRNRPGRHVYRPDGATHRAQ